MLMHPAWTGISHKHCRIVQRNGGWAYAQKPGVVPKGPLAHLRAETSNCLKWLAFLRGSALVEAIMHRLKLSLAPEKTQALHLGGNRSRMPHNLECMHRSSRG